MKYEDWIKLEAAEAELARERVAVLERVIADTKAACPAQTANGLFDVKLEDVERAVRWWRHGRIDERPKLPLGAFLVAAVVHGWLPLEPRNEERTAPIGLDKAA
jgi:hypothetical protein